MGDQEDFWETILVPGNLAFSAERVARLRDFRAMDVLDEHGSMEHREIT